MAPATAAQGRTASALPYRTGQAKKAHVDTCFRRRARRPDAPPHPPVAPLVLSGSMGAMLRVLRLCSVFEPRELSPAWVPYDPIGGMQNHVAELTRCLDRLGVAQLVVTSRLAGPADRARFGAHS